MGERQPKKKFWIGISVLFALSFLIKGLGPAMVTLLYRIDALAFLNALTGVPRNYPVEFYTGVWDDRLFGPASVLCSGLALLMLGWKFKDRLTARHIAISVFVYLILTKVEVLFFPPYGDSASGPFMEAVWLLHNGFNYAKLAQETLFFVGGPKAYLVSLYPGFQALLMTVIPWTKVFLAVNHVLSFALASVTMALFFKMAQRVLGKVKAFVLTFVFFSLPLVQSQIEQINMEVPVLFFLVLGLEALTRKDILRAAVFCGIATFVKMYAIFGAVTVLAAGIFLICFDEEKKDKRRLWAASALALVVAAVGAYALCFIVNKGAQVAMVGAFQGWPLMRRFPVTYFFLTSVIVYGVFLWRQRGEGGRPQISNLIALLRTHDRILFMFVATALWFGVFLNSLWIPPRYTLILLPSLIIVIAVAGQVLIKKEKVFCSVAIGIIVLSLASSYGLFYRPIEIQDYSVVERSLEYRNDVKLHLRLGKILEDRYDFLTVAAPFNMAQMYGFPELGFVRKKLDVMIFLFPCTYGGIRNFDGLENLDVRKVVWIGIKMPFIVDAMFPVGPYDHVVETLYSGNKSVQLFFGGFSVDKVYKAGQLLMKGLKERGFKNKIDL